jgi:DNA-binding transcriptional MerR regulator
MQEQPIKKLYYSISEVAKKTELKQYVLRYWETEFEELCPVKNRAGNRIYREEDIEVINQIKDLLYTKKFTIKGARNYLKQIANGNKSQNKVQQVIVLDAVNREPGELIESIQNELEEALHILNGAQKNK